MQFYEYYLIPYLNYLQYILKNTLINILMRNLKAEILYVNGGHALFHMADWLATLFSENRSFDRLI